MENSIPEWNSEGCLPFEVERIKFSPYQTTTIEFVKRFGNTDDRKNILRKWLHYRLAISAKIQYGFEWVNGSFVENVEKTRKSSPHDIDVVDFVVFAEELPTEEYKLIKRRYGVDAYLFPLLSKEKIASLDEKELFAWYDSRIQKIAQWSLVWGHTHDDNSKGFVKINFNTVEDCQALRLLEEF